MRVSISITLVVASLLCVAHATWQGCGDPCVNNNQCDDALCSMCVNGHCQSGSTCGSSCIVDSECERLRYCYLCTSKKCGPGPLYPAQCKTCNTDGDCNSASRCGTCLPDTSVPGGKRCGAGCGGPCINAYDCGYGTECSSCDLSTKTCVPGGKCGTSCGTDADCMQSPDNNCRLCIDFTCSAPCKSACNSTFDCNAPVTGCGRCDTGVCLPGVECGSRCLYDRDCSGAGVCLSCVAGRCAQGNQSQCNSTCTSPQQCGTGGNCPACTFGYCTPPQCGSMCTANSDCGNSGYCSSCTKGQCTPPQCGSTCSIDTDCKGAKGCFTCQNSVCAPPQCGSKCLTDTDCGNAATCTQCQSGLCTQPTPNNCGINHPCDPGNNNQCPPTTCSRCDPFTGTCRLGGPCGAACIVNSDCNQLGSCKRCGDICQGDAEFRQHALRMHPHMPKDTDIEVLAKMEDMRKADQLAARKLRKD